MKYLRLLEKFNNDKSTIRVYDEVSSTSDVVRQYFEKDKISICIAVRQSSGKGRLGRSFSAEEGGIYISFAKRFEGDMQAVFSIMPLSALCVCTAVDGAAPVGSLSIKWPNDVLLGGKKLCGILAEGFMHEDDFYIVLGIGINVNNPIPKELTNAVSLKEALGKEENEEIIAEKLIYEVTKLLSTTAKQREDMFSAYREKCDTLGKNVSVRQGDKVIEGLVTGITKEGGLIILDGLGKENVIISGEATILKI